MFKKFKVLNLRNLRVFLKKLKTFKFPMMSHIVSILSMIGNNEFQLLYLQSLMRLWHLVPAFTVLRHCLVKYWNGGLTHQGNLRAPVPHWQFFQSCQAPQNDGNSSPFDCKVVARHDQVLLVIFRIELLHLEVVAHHLNLELCTSVGTKNPQQDISRHAHLHRTYVGHVSKLEKPSSVRSVLASSTISFTGSYWTWHSCAIWLPSKLEVKVQVANPYWYAVWPKDSLTRLPNWRDPRVDGFQHHPDTKERTAQRIKIKGAPFTRLMMAKIFLLCADRPAWKQLGTKYAATLWWTSHVHQPQVARILHAHWSISMISSVSSVCHKVMLFLHVLLLWCSNVF